MTQEEKELLLKDLCARLPYGVFCSMGLDYPLPLQRLFVDKLDGILLDFYENGKDYQVYLSEVKPYLRPMSSMTEEEEKIYNSFINCIATNECGSWELVDWLNSNQFDYHGLIPMGLALEAPEGEFHSRIFEIN